MGDSHVGLQARLMSQALRKLTGAVSRSNAAVIFTNQIREKIGVMFGSPETTSGGRALSSTPLCAWTSAASERSRTGRGDRQPDPGQGGQEQVRAPFKQAEFDILYGKGISHTGLLIDIGVERGIVDKSGSWFSYGDLRLGQGKENVRELPR